MDSRSTSYSRDHLGFHTMYLNNLKKIFNKTSELIPCSPLPHLDPRAHLNGPFISIRKVQKHLDLGRREALEERRRKLKELFACDRQKWECELSKEGLTLATVYTKTMN